MKILITGGAGYLGSKLALALRGAGHEVEIFDLPKNILNANELGWAIEGKDIVYHLAALAELIYTDAHPQQTFEVNIVGLNNVARLCAEHKVVLEFASTCCIYGNPLEYPSVEDSLVNPSDTYAMTKAAGESIVKMWGLSQGLKYNILRFGTIYGQSVDGTMRGDMCIQRFLRAALNGEEITVDGSGKQSRNFVHIDDLVRGLVLLAEKKPVNQTFNLAGSESISVNDIAEYALEFGASGIIRRPIRKDDFNDQDVSLSKAWAILGWKPEILFSDGIRNFFTWLQQNNASKRP